MSERLSKLCSFSIDITSVVWKFFITSHYFTLSLLKAIHEFTICHEAKKTFPNIFKLRTQFEGVFF